MSTQAGLICLIMFALSSRVLATDGSHHEPSLLVCSSSCVRTVTVTSSASYSILPSPL
ncbi:hypothetical protein WAI453_010259 [Rhynchosporium graminicola]